MSISNIDDLLMGVGNSQQPATPEHKEKQNEKPQEAPEYIEENQTENIEYDNDVSSETNKEDQSNDNEIDDQDTENKEEENKEIKPESSEEELDEYGNKKERMSKGMKERLDRKEKQHQREIEQREQEIQNLRQQLSSQGASSQVQKAAADFKYDPNNEESWQQQLTDFVKSTVSNMQTEQQQRERQIKEQHIEREFHEKFTKGMQRFDDFREVVSSQPIDDAMTLSLRGIKDPSAFIYAASKRQPQELKRISELRDPYARMVEMGKLEERMRRNKPTTKTPKPLGRIQEDAAIKTTEKQKDNTGDDLLAKADANRLAIIKTRHKINR